MSKLQELGFLSDEAKESEADIVQDFVRVFDLFDKLSVLFIDALSNAKIEPESTEGLVIHAAAARALELSQSADILLRKGCVPAAKLVCRTQLEAVYKLCAIIKNSDLAHEYISQSKFSRLQKLKSIQKYQQDYPDSKAAPNLTKEIDELSVAAKSLKKLAPHDWASKAEMDDFHRVYYQGLSDDTHGNIETLDHYFDKNSDYAFCFGPSVQDLNIVAHACQRGMVNAIIHYTSYVGNSNPEILKPISDEVDQALYDSDAG